MDKTPPKTPGWGSSLFGWGNTTAKKERAKDTRDSFSGASPPPRMPALIGQLDLVSGPTMATGPPDHSTVSDQKPSPQQFRPSSVSKVSFAPSVAHQSPWGAQASSASWMVERTATPGNQLLPFGHTARKAHKSPIVKRRTTQPKYRPSSATLNTHMGVAAPQKFVDEIRKSLIFPRDLLPPPEREQLSLGNTLVLRKGRTLNESHSRLLEAHQRKRRAMEGAGPQNANLLLANAHDTQRRRVKFQEQMSKNSLLMSPQSTASPASSSQNSSQSGNLEPLSLRPRNVDDAYMCIPETGEDSYGVDSTLLRGAPKRCIPAFVPPKPRKRQPETDLIVKTDLVVKVGDGGSSKEKVAATESEEASQPKKQRLRGDNTWECQNCHTQNHNDESACTKCEERRSSKPAASSWGSTFDRFQGWFCKTCRTKNPDMSRDQCQSCGEPRHDTAGASLGETNNPAVSTPASTATSSSIGTGGFLFASASTNGGSSGSNSKTPSTLASTGGGLKFSTFSGDAEQTKSTSAGVSSFGSATGLQMPVTSRPVETSGLGGDASISKPTSDKGITGAFIFGGGQTSSAGINPSSLGLTSSFSSESKLAQPAPAVGGFSFGAPSLESKAPQHAPAAVGFSFGAPSLESKAPQHAPAAVGFSFGAPSSESNAPQPAPASDGFMFGTVFSESETRQSAPATGGLKFGTASSESKATQPAVTAGGFSFGATSSENRTPLPTPETGDLSFGATVLESKASQPTPAAGGFSFGGTATKTQDSHSDSTNGAVSFTFGAPRPEIAKEEKSSEGPTPLFVFGNASSKEKEGKFGSNSGPPGPSSGFAWPAPLSDKKEVGKITGGSGIGFAPSDPKSLNSTPPENGDQAMGSSFSVAPFGTSSNLVPQDSETDSSRQKKARDEPEGTGIPLPAFQFGSSRDFGTGAPNVPGTAPSFGAPTSAPGPGSQFGTHTPSAGFQFGSTNATEAFVPSGFGVAPAPSGQSGFGAAPAPVAAVSFGQSGFGAAPASGPSFGQTPTFGASSAPPPFVSMSAPSPGFQPNFSFGGGAPAPPPAPTAFGASAPPSFGNPTQSFGAPPPNGLSFGSAPPQFGSFPPQNGGMSQSNPGFAAPTPGGGFGAQDAFSMGTAGNARRRRIKAKRPMK